MSSEHLQSHFPFLALHSGSGAQASVKLGGKRMEHKGSEVSKSS